ncbi:MAG: hypothetical protein ACRDJE_23565, partial [Dehalococcoidia bacterium]
MATALRIDTRFTVLCSDRSHARLALATAHQTSRGSAMTYEDLTYETGGHIATIALDRPDRLNAIS